MRFTLLLIGNLAEVVLVAAITAMALIPFFLM